MKYSSFAKEILAMYAADQALRARLAASGELFAAYNEEMENLHIANAQRLEEIMQEVDWPSHSKVGEEANQAALIIVQHAISLPEFQRNCLKIIKQAVDNQQEKPQHYAYLYDRICFNERRPQRYGTQYDWDEAGLMSPWKIEDPAQVDKRRLALGLNPLAEQTLAIRQGLEEKNHPPVDFETRQKAIEEWAKRLGWI